MKDEERSPFGRKLRALRMAKEWSQGELAKRAGLNIHTVAYLECAGRAAYDKPVGKVKRKPVGPHKTTVAKLACALGCKVGDLVDDPDPDPELSEPDEFRIEWVSVGGTLKPKLARRDSNSRPTV
jgi:transcriptional regulator with XRE-family HTH domain